MQKGETVWRLLSSMLVFLLGCQLVLASESMEGASAEGSTRSVEANSAASSSAASPAAEISEMKELIENQRRRIEKLQATVEQQQRRLDSTMTAMAAGPVETLTSGSSTAAVRGESVDSEEAQEKLSEIDLLKAELEAVAESAAQANQRLTRIESDTGAMSKTVGSKEKQLGNFSFSGDVRARYEPFIQEGTVTRNRERFRVRLNLTGKVSDEFSGGISLATGSLDDPVSTNQTITGFFNRKNFGLDKAYITYKPKYAPFLKLDAGKFAYPWYRTGLTFDGDINPEGFAQTLSFDLKSSSLRNITLVGFQLPINETSSGHDSFVFGGQVQTQFRINSRVRLGLYGAGININRANPIAVAIGNGSLKPSLSNSNTFIVNSSGAVTGYATKFAYLDTIMKLEMDTNPRFPTTVLFNFVNNTRGSRERSGYWAEVSFGRNKEQGDIQFGYTFVRIEKDAVIGAWNESDLRSATNVRNHRLSFGYMVKGNLTGSFTAWMGRLANAQDNLSLVPSAVRGTCSGSGVAGCDPLLKRLQFDMIYKF